MRSQGGQLCLERDFQAGEVIGSGSFGRVFAARHQASGQIVAVKEVVLERGGAAGSDEGPDLRRELRICEQLRHRHVVQYIGHELLAPGGEGGSEQLRLFLEYCSGGSLLSHLRTYGSLAAPLMTKYAGQLAGGLQYLHSREPPVVHRDLKCANLLLTHDADVKIGDFGCSKWLPQGDLREGQNTMVGSIFWMAPEMLRGDKHVTMAIDIWSLGCCFVEMATAKPPWAERKLDNIFHACRLIVESDDVPSLPEDMPADLRAFVQACLRREPGERTLASDLSRHRLLSSPGDPERHG